MKTMNTFACRFLSMVAVLLAALTFSVRANAGLVVTLAPSSITDLSNVHVGDMLYFVTRGGTDVAADVAEHLLSPPPVHLFADLDIFDIFTYLGVYGSWSDDLHSDPRLVIWQLQPNAAGTVTLFNGFSDCNGLPSDTSGCAITNLGATRPADSNRITFTIYNVPEPSTLAVFGVGLLALAGLRQRKAKSA